MNDPFNDPGISVFFTVEVDGVDLGAWDTCTGMAIQLETTGRGDSAMSFWMHHIPGHVTYSNITLGRPLSPDSQRIIDWLNQFSLMPIPTAAEIKALDPSGVPIIAWSLWGVIPVKWTGPSFDAGSLKVVTEQLEIAYQGFL